MMRQGLCHAWPAVSVPQHLRASLSVASLFHTCAGGQADENGEVYGAVFGGMSFADLYGYFRNMFKVCV